MHVSSRMASSVLCEWWMQRRRREKKILHIFSTLFVGHVSRTYLFVDYYLFFSLSILLRLCRSTVFVCSCFISSHILFLLNSKRHAEMQQKTMHRKEENGASSWHCRRRDEYNKWELRKKRCARERNIEKNERMSWNRWKHNYIYNAAVQLHLETCDHRVDACISTKRIVMFAVMHPERRAQTDGCIVLLRTA